MLLNNRILLEGEKEIYLSQEIDQGYKSIYLEPFPKANPHAIAEIMNADVIVLGPGGLHTSLIPNLLVNVGGAELTGYYTHYHAMYLPIIWALATVSLVKYSSKSKRTKFPRSALLAFVLISTVLSILSITQVRY